MGVLVTHPTGSFAQILAWFKVHVTPFKQGSHGSLTRPGHSSGIV